MNKSFEEWWDRVKYMSFVSHHHRETSKSLFSFLHTEYQEKLNRVKGELHERESRIKALEFKLNEVAPVPIRNSGSR